MGWQKKISGAKCNQKSSGNINIVLFYIFNFLLKVDILCTSGPISAALLLFSDFSLEIHNCFVLVHCKAYLLSAVSKTKPFDSIFSRNWVKLHSRNCDKLMVSRWRVTTVPLWPKILCFFIVLCWHVNYSKRWSTVMSPTGFGLSILISILSASMLFSGARSHKLYRYSKQNTCLLITRQTFWCQITVGWWSFLDI